MLRSRVPNPDAPTEARSGTDTERVVNYSIGAAVSPDYKSSFPQRPTRSFSVRTGSLPEHQWW